MVLDLSEIGNKLGAELVSHRSAESTQDFPLPKFPFLDPSTPTSRELRIFVESRQAGFVGEDIVANMGQRLGMRLNPLDIFVKVAAIGDDMALSVIPFSVVGEMREEESRVISLDGRAVKLTAAQTDLGTIKDRPTLFEEAISQIDVQGFCYLADIPQELKASVLRASPIALNQICIKHYKAKESGADVSHSSTEASISTPLGEQPPLAAPAPQLPSRCAIIFRKLFGCRSYS